MRVPRWSLPLAGALLGAAACAVAANPSVCRRGGVEWIVGGPSADTSACDASSARAAPGPAPASNGVSSPTRWRDGDGAAERRQILEQELRQEQAALAAAQRPGAAADAAALGRTRANITALQGELARLPPASR